MSDYFEVIGISSTTPKGFLEYIAEDQGIRTIPVEMTRKVTPFKDLMAIIRLYRIFRHEKPHIVHTHTPKAGMVGIIAAYLARVPHRLHTIAGLPLLEITGFKRSILNIVEKITYSCATKVYPNSQGLKQIAIDLKFAKPEKLKVIGKGSSNGIDTSHYDSGLFSTDEVEKLRTSLGIDKQDFVYLFVGRLVKDKGINELVKAFEKLASEINGLKLLLVGFYEKDLDPLEKATERNIETNENIVMAGPQRDVRPYMALSDLLVFPSYREGFPNVVMEAGSMGLPCIVTDINGCNEIIINGENGMLVPPKSEDELYNLMKGLYLDHKKLKNLAKNARELITSRYEREYIWSELLKEYQQLNEGSRS